MSSNILKTIQNVGGAMQEKGKLAAQKFKNRHTQSIGGLVSNSQILRIEEENVVALKNRNNLVANHHIQSLRYSGLMTQETVFDHNDQSFSPNPTKQFNISPKAQITRKIDLPPLNTLKIQKFNQSFSPSHLKKKGHTLSDNLPFNIQPYPTTNTSSNLTNHQILSSPLKKQSSKPIFKVKTVSENSNGYLKWNTNPSSPLKVKSCVELMEDQPRAMRDLNQLLKHERKLEQKQKKQDENQMKDISFCITTEAVPVDKKLTFTPQYTEVLPIENEIFEDYPDDDSMNDIQELQEKGFKLRKQQDKYQDELYSFHKSELEDNPQQNIYPLTKNNINKFKNQDVTSKRTSFLSIGSNLLDYSEISPSRVSPYEQKNYNKPYDFLQQLKIDSQSQFQNQSQYYKTRDGFNNEFRKTSIKQPFSPTKQQIKQQYPVDITFQDAESDYQSFCNCQYAFQSSPSTNNSPTKKATLNYQQLNKNSSSTIRLQVKKPKTLQVICPSNDYSKNRQYKKYHSSSVAFNPKDYIAI